MCRMEYAEKFQNLLSKAIKEIKTMLKMMLILPEGGFVSPLIMITLREFEIEVFNLLGKRKLRWRKFYEKL